MNWYRSRRDKFCTGLCGGIAESMNIDATILRLILVALTFFSGGGLILIYIVASIIIPKEPMYDGPGGFDYDRPRRSHRRSSHGFDPYENTDRRDHAETAGMTHASNVNVMSENTSNLDDMMKDLEKKAMEKEIEELRAKLAKYEKGEE